MTIEAFAADLADRSAMLAAALAGDLPPPDRAALGAEVAEIEAAQRALAVYVVEILGAELNPVATAIV